MHQIDVMLTSHRREMSEREAVVKSQLQGRERELSALRVTVQERNAQVSKTCLVGENQKVVAV